MSERQGGPFSNPAVEVAQILEQIDKKASRALLAVTTSRLPPPLQWRVTALPANVFKVEIVNPATGGAINLGSI